MKKKILVMMTSLFLGGAERSLLGLVEAINKAQYDIDLFLFRHEGELLPLIPKEVHLLNSIPEWTTFDRPIKKVLFSPQWRCAVARLRSKIAIIKSGGSGTWQSMQYTSKYLTPCLPEIPGHYDMAISFLGIPYYMQKVDADIKLAWVHTDYAMLNPNQAMDREAYQNVDHVVTVSDLCEVAFLKRYPELAAKSLVMENIMPKEGICHQATLIDTSAEMPDTGGLKLLSLGRFCEAKNFDNVPVICKRLLDFGFDITWYLIGYGGDEKLIRSRIIETGMEKRVIILGKKDNPYPYIKACDLYVQPSRYEGKCVSVREAQMLGKSVVITNYATASDQLKDGIDGIIVPLDNESCAAGIATLIRNPQKQELLRHNCANGDFSNADEIHKLYDIMVK